MPNQFESRGFTVTNQKIEEFSYLFRAVEAEAGICGLYEKKLVASAILNRVKSDDYPDTIKGVITEPGQFQVYSNNRMFEVEVTDSTRRAVMAVLKGKFRSEVQSFCNPDLISESNIRYFETLELVIEAEYMNYYK